MIKIRNLVKSFGEQVVLNCIDMSVAKKEVVVIIGASGSGKSTLLRCLNFLEMPDQGEIILMGEMINPDKINLNKVREEVGMVFQHFNLFPHMNVLENVMEAPVTVRKLDKAQAIQKSMTLLENFN